MALWMHVLLILTVLLPLGIFSRPFPTSSRVIHAPVVPFEHQDGDYIPLFANKSVPINYSDSCHRYFKSKDDVDTTEDAGIWVSNIQGQQYYVYRDECKLDRFRRRKQDHGFRDDVDIAFYLCIIIAIWFGLLLVVTWALLRNSVKRRIMTTLPTSNLPQGIHGDGCRCPPNSSLLGAFLGNGTQLLIMICSFLFLSNHGALYPVVSTCILAAYGLTSFVAGYVATSFHRYFSPIGWKARIFQTRALYSLPSTLTFLLLYTLEGNTSGFPDLLYPGARNFLLQSVLFATTQLWTGGIIGHFVTPRDHQAPCAFTRLQGHTSGQPWYSRTTVQMFFGGLLPFTAIFWMMDDIHASLWNSGVATYL